MHSKGSMHAGKGGLASKGTMGRMSHNNIKNNNNNNSIGIIMIIVVIIVIIKRKEMKKRNKFWSMQGTD
jgi:hypothetical protein